MTRLKKPLLILVVLSILTMSCICPGMNLFQNSDEDSNTSNSHNNIDGDIEITTYPGMDLNSMELSTLELEDHIMVVAYDPSGDYLPEIRFPEKDDYEEFKLALRDVSDVEPEDAFGKHIVRDVDINGLLDTRIGSTTMDDLNEFIEDEADDAFGLLLAVPDDADARTDVSVYQTPEQGVYLVLADELNSSLPYDSSSIKLMKPNREGLLIGVVIVLQFIVVPAIPILLMTLEMNEPVTVENFTGATIEEINKLKELAALTALSGTGGGELAELGHAFVQMNTKELYIYIESAKIEYTTCTNQSELNTVVDQTPEAGDRLVPMKEDLILYVCTDVEGTETESVQQNNESESVEEPVSNVDWQTIDIEGIGINIAVPSGWEADPYDLDEMVTEGQVGLAYIDPESDNNVLFTFVARRKDVDIQQYGMDVKSDIEDYTSDTVKKTLVNYDDTFNVDGYSAVLIEFTTEFIEEEYTLHEKNIVTTNGDWFIAFSLLTEEEYWDPYQGLFVNMIDVVEMY